MSDLRPEIADSTAENSPHLAGVRRRFASLFYEAFLLVPILFISAYLFLALTQAARTPLLHALFQLWLVSVLGAYFSYCWQRGQTLAMRTWHIRLAQKDGSRPSTRQALLRYGIALFGFFLGGIGFWWALADRERQFLHDRLAGTRLVDSKPRRNALRVQQVQPS
ncbi:MAG: RDD family protein [Betaproteobacteria bacterium]